MDKKHKIIKKYEGKILATPNTGGQIKYGVHDFLIEGDLISFLYDYFDHEVDFTKSGYDFINEYYGLYQLAKMIYAESKIGPICNEMEVIEIAQYIKERGYLLPY